MHQCWWVDGGYHCRNQGLPWSRAVGMEGVCAADRPKMTAAKARVFESKHIEAKRARVSAGVLPNTLDSNQRTMERRGIGAKSTASKNKTKLKLGPSQTQWSRARRLVTAGERRVPFVV